MYRTVSDEAALLLAFITLADLLGLERMMIRFRLGAPIIPGAPLPSKKAVKIEERKATITLWQARGSTSSNASWTRLAIPDVSRWLGRTVPEVPLTYHMTQALTGHGCFQHYLHQRGRAASSRCYH